jgi:dihydroxyacetone kinase
MTRLFELVAGTRTASTPPLRSVVVLVNFLTSMTMIERHVFTRELLRYFATPSHDDGPLLVRFFHGSWLSSLNMSGLSITVLLNPSSEEITSLDAPTPCLAWSPAVIPSTYTPLLPSSSSPAPASSPSSSPASSPSSSPASSPATAETGGPWRQVITAIATHCASETTVAELNSLDQARGDGDTGFAVGRGATAVLAQVATLPWDQPALLLAELGNILHHAMAGSSGAILCSGLHGLAEALAQHPSDVAGALRNAAAMISQLGGAQAGDSTLLDALLPAAAAAATAPGSATPVFPWAALAAAASAGAAQTAKMLPQQGRSFYVGTRALGHVDPGARLLAIIFEIVANQLSSPSAAT